MRAGVDPTEMISCDPGDADRMQYVSAWTSVGSFRCAPPSVLLATASVLYPGSRKFACGSLVTSNGRSSVPSGRMVPRPPVVVWWGTHRGADRRKLRPSSREYISHSVSCGNVLP